MAIPRIVSEIKENIGRKSFARQGLETWKHGQFAEQKTQDG